MAHHLSATTFLTLPTELRLQIFNYHFQSIPLTFVPLRGGPPPLLLVSKIVRVEALYSFYSKSRFTLDVRPVQSSTVCGPPVFGESCVQQVVDQDTENFYLSLPKAMLGHIKHLQLRVGGCTVGRVAIDVDLCGDSGDLATGRKGVRNRFKVKMLDLVRGETKVHLFTGCAWEGVVMRQVEKLVREIVDEEGDSKLKINHVAAFAVALSL